MKKRYKKLAIVVILILILLVVCPSLKKRLGLKWIQYNELATSYPTSGEYWNEDLDLYLCFFDGKVMIEHASGLTEPIDVHPAGRFTNQDNTFNAWYVWSKEFDEITLTLIAYERENSSKNEYTFVRIH